MIKHYFAEKPENYVMSKILIIVLIVISSCSSMKHYNMFQYENGNDYVSEGMYRIVNQRGRIGYADESGRAVIKPRFAFGFPFENGKAKVTDKGEMKEVPGSDGEYHYWESDEWYYINKEGKRIKPE